MSFVTCEILVLKLIASISASSIIVFIYVECYF